jgi:mannose-6-phosphate isomerase-like protein (cupin superfamily)
LHPWRIGVRRRHPGARFSRLLCAQEKKKMKRNFMKPAVIILALFAMFPLRGADSTGAMQWTAAQFNDKQKDLATKLDQTKSGMEQLLKEASYNVVLVHREGSGQGEIHQNLADFIIVRSGQGAILVGGQAINSKPTAPGELRGDRVEGGTRHALNPGDMLYIPANTPHQFLLEKGKVINAIIIKVEPQK